LGAFSHRNGTLATITLNVTGSPPGPCDLTLNDMGLVDVDGNLITHLLQHGSFQMVGVLAEDLNGDGVVDMSDIRTAACALASYGRDGPNHAYLGLQQHLR
jgi:hypothetical protein